MNKPVNLSLTFLKKEVTYKIFQIVIMSRLKTHDRKYKFLIHFDGPKGLNPNIILSPFFQRPSHIMNLPRQW
jgi:hypothetical protein